jgi:trehalose-phosphatase
MIMHQQVITEKSFLGSICKSSGSLLMIDYDGTLAPFQVKRNEAIPEKILLRQLEELQTTGKCRVIIISGRFLDDLIPLVNLHPLPELWGSHGLERLNQQGEKTSYTLPREIKAALENEHRYFRQVLQEKDVEKKPFSIAIHWRGKPVEEAQKLEKLVRGRWESLSKKGSLEMHAFNNGLELRLQGMGKGEAVKQILMEIDPHIPCAYVGDDLTDEEAFLALGNRGFKILLRHHSQSTLADMEINSTAQLAEFLGKWIKGATIHG